MKHIKRAMKLAANIILMAIVLDILGFFSANRPWNSQYCMQMICAYFSLTDDNVHVQSSIHYSSKSLQNVLNVMNIFIKLTKNLCR